MQLMLDKLEGKQRKKLQEVLMSAFLSFTKLEQMVSFGFNENLNNIAGGHNSDLGYVIFKLIEWAEANGKLQKLLIVVRSEEDGGNPSNAKLKEICEELQQGQIVRKQSYELMDRSQFDLTELIAECRNNLLGKNGLVGLALPCKNYICLESFCQRLKDEFLGRNIQCQDSLSLNPKHSPVDIAIKRIQKCKIHLQKGDIIYPIQVEAKKNSSDYKSLWQHISADFKENFKYRLIVIFWGSKKGNYLPQDVIQLKAPNFTTTHVFDWIFKVSNTLEWEEEVIVQWKNKMIDDCLDQKSKQLDLELVYDHLKFSIELLKEQPSKEDFLEKLNQRIQAYVS